MLRTKILLLFLIFSSATFCQQIIEGIVVDSSTNIPVEGATVTLLPSQTSTITNASGRFIFKRDIANATSLVVTNIGYTNQTIPIAAVQKNNRIAIAQRQILLQDVTVVANEDNQYKPISRTDIAIRSVDNSQEILRIIPGIVIGQHQGGGKAEQIFLRGFDADHGTDFRMDVDGLPINMVSHAHGQGFADSHFIIPETIGSVDFKKGPYTAGKGDFATTGFVDYNTMDALSSNVVKEEGGMFNSYRVLGMFNLLNRSAKAKQQSWYVASEYRYSNSYFDHPQHFNRFNVFTKYNGKISAHSYLRASATMFWSKWDASGQIPERAVKEGITGFYGAIDPYEGGLTYRTNANIALTTTLNNGGVLKNQLYYARSHFDLHTNFTFYLVDTVNGDEIRQKEDRDLAGYNGSYNNAGFWGNTKITTNAGLQVRLDKTHNSELSHTVDRYTTLQQIKLGDISEWNIAPYLNETFRFNDHFSINAGLRFDQFYFRYNNKLRNASTWPGTRINKAAANTFSPKLNFYYHTDNNLQFYLTTGKGFHSNDARSAVVENGYQSLPAAYSADLGTVFKPAKNVLINAAIWYIYLQQEFVYSGDGGFVEFTGKTRRVGFDFSGRYQPIYALYFDVDINYAHGRTIGEAKGENYIPLAPIWTNSGGITYLNKRGLNGSLRYRYVADRPANEDYSLTAKGYFIIDAVLNYTKRKYEIGLVINNTFNTRWKETQFATVTRLKGEAKPVDEVCFTPGTPFNAKISFTFFFR